VHSIARLEDWVQTILVDPLDKSPLRQAQDSLLSDYGRSYPIRRGIPDLRCLSQHVGVVGKLWRSGQEEYEKWSEKLSRVDSTNDYVAEREGVRDVYETIPITGRCLDVGGHQGRLRAFLDARQEYLIVDPWLNALAGLDNQPRLLEAYPFLRNPVNFICALAEHLPLKCSAFDTVHMRSCVDHFLNPELAILEAHRVLKPGGQLVVGLYVEGGRTGRQTIAELTKETARKALSMFTHAYEDHHIWHPSYVELRKLLEGCGLRIEQTHWQRAFVDRVCYIKAVKD